MHDKEIKALREQMAAWMAAEMSKGADAADGQSLMYAADIIKDLSEAECRQREAEYYGSVTEAMDRYDGRMGYEPRRDGRGRFMRSGYTDPTRHAEPVRYDDRDMDDGYDPRYGRPFNAYRTAKRHYTETHSEADKKAMRDHENEHLMDAIATFREMWGDADPDMRKRIKAELTRLTNDMQA